MGTNMQSAPEGNSAIEESETASAPVETPGLDVDLTTLADAFGQCIPCAVQEVLKQQDAAHNAQRETLNNQLRDAINQIPQAVALFDADERLIICNDAFRAFYGLTPEQSQRGTSCWSILERGLELGFRPADSENITSDRITRFVSEHGSWRGVVQVRDGRFIHTIHEPLQSGGWITIQDDVTEQRRHEDEELARLNEAQAQSMRFNAAIDNMKHGLSMFDADRRLVVCNETFVQLYQLPRHLSEPGTPFIEIFRHRHSVGMTPEGIDFETGYATIGRLIDNAGSINAPSTMASGRVIMVNHQPLADGGWLSTHEDITEQHRNAETIRYLAHHDSLTGLANRATFLEAMAEAEARIDDGELLAVICIDLDRFKEINDTLGHAVGDAVLTGVSKRLRAVLDERGLTARLGGDEFAALIGPLESPAEALELARTLMETLQAPLTVGNASISCGASCGIALAPQHGHDAQTLMRCADLALYRAKAESPGYFCLFESRMDVAQRRRQAIEHGLRCAVQNRSITLMYQPLVSLESGRVACCEALMRWQSPDLGMVAPSEFIPVAEETGLIRDLGVWALEAACTEATRWPCHVRVAVNVSPVQFHGDDLVEHVTWALVRSGLEPSRLELEITESLFLADDAHNLEVLHKLRDLGVRIALDDFGTGYSSLAYMLKFPFDKVKIDRAIVSTIAEKPETVAMVTAIVDLCRGFEMRTVAEGIETEEQLAEVKAHGCDEVQGYIFSPPLPQSAIVELLRRKQVPASRQAPSRPQAKRA